MTTLHIARAVGSTAADAAPYRVELRAGHHRFLADEPPTEGGGDVGPSPMGLLLSGLAACTAITLRMYAERKGWDLASIAVAVRYDIDASGHASIERTITVPFTLPIDQRGRLAEVAERTPVTLAIGTPIHTTIEQESRQHIVDHRVGARRDDY